MNLKDRSWLREVDRPQALRSASARWASRQHHIEAVATDVRPIDLARPESGAQHPRTRLLYSGRRWARWLVCRKYVVRVHGKENVADQGPVILAGNHVGLLDGPLLAVCSPRPVQC